MLISKGKKEKVLKMKNPEPKKEILEQTKERKETLQNYLQENDLDPRKDWTKDPIHGDKVRALIRAAKISSEKLVETTPKEFFSKKRRTPEEREQGIRDKKVKKDSPKREPLYDYPLVNGVEMTSEEKRKYRIAQRKLKSKETPKKEKDASVKEKKAPKKIIKKKEVIEEED